MWLPRFQRKGKPTIKPALSLMPLLFFLLWSITSSVWSAYHLTSLYASVEYASLVVCTLVMSHVVTTRAFLRGLVLGITVTLIASLVDGHYESDPFSGKYSLVGLFGSKNMIGLFAEMLIIVSLLLRYVTEGKFARLFISTGPLLLGLVCLFESKSATSVVSLVCALSVWSLLKLVSILPKKVRGITFVFVMFWCVVFFVVGYTFDVQDEILRLFGKSSDLTGRTYLWGIGMQHGLDNFLMGHGYAGFWVQGNIPAEALWFKFGIANRIGFHFHNLYVQTFVDLGAIGVSTIAFLLLWTCIQSIGSVLRHGMVIDYVMGGVLAVMFLVRSYAEVDILGTFSIGPMVFFALLPRVRSAELSKQGQSDVDVPILNGTGIKPCWTK